MLVLPSFSSFPSPRRRTRFFFPLSLPQRLLFLSYDGPSVDPFAVRGTRDPLLSAILRCPSSPPASRFSEIPTPDSDAARCTLDAYRCVTQAKSHPGRAGFLSRSAISSVSILQRAVPVFAERYAYFLDISCLLPRGSVVEISSGSMTISSSSQCLFYAS